MGKGMVWAGLAVRQNRGGDWSGMGLGGYGGGLEPGKGGITRQWGMECGVKGEGIDNEGRCEL